MLNKEMLLCTGGETPPEPGYVKAKLTIEQVYEVVREGRPAEFAGYGFLIDTYLGGSDTYGDLTPRNGYTKLYASDVSRTSFYLYGTRPFYFNGEKYCDNSYGFEDLEITDQTGSTVIRPIYYEFKSNLGKTVDVWLAPE